MIKRPMEYIRMATNISLPASIPKSTNFSNACSSLLPGAAFNNNQFIFFFVLQIKINQLISVEL